MHVTLMENALERITQARLGWGQADCPEKQALQQSAVQIVAELRSNLNLSKGGPYAANLDDLCDYMSRLVAMAIRQNRVAALDEVADLLSEVRAAWAAVFAEVRPS